MIRFSLCQSLAAIMFRHEKDLGQTRGRGARSALRAAGTESDASVSTEIRGEVHHKTDDEGDADHPEDALSNGLHNRPERHRNGRCTNVDDGDEDANADGKTYTTAPVADTEVSLQGM